MRSRSWDLSPFIFTPGPTINAKRRTRRSRRQSTPSPARAVVATRVSAELGGSASYKTTDRLPTASTCERRRRSEPVSHRRLVASSEESARGYLRAEGSVGAVVRLTGRRPKCTCACTALSRTMRRAARDFRVVTGSVRDLQQRSLPSARRALQAAWTSIICRSAAPVCAGSASTFRSTGSGRQMESSSSASPTTKGSWGRGTVSFCNFW